MGRKGKVYYRHTINTCGLEALNEGVCTCVPLHCTLPEDKFNAQKVLKTCTLSKGMHGI